MGAENEFHTSHIVEVGLGYSSLLDDTPWPFFPSAVDSRKLWDSHSFDGDFGSCAWHNVQHLLLNLQSRACSSCTKAAREEGRVLTRRNEATKPRQVRGFFFSGPPPAAARRFDHLHHEPLLRLGHTGDAFELRLQLRSRAALACATCGLHVTQCVFLIRCRLPMMPPAICCADVASTRLPPEVSRRTAAIILP